MKIGLIAMSGIRACDTELLELGLTLPGFVERSRTIASLPSLGLLTLAGMTPAEHEVAYIEVEDINTLDHLPGPFDLVAISSFSAQINEGYELARRYTEEGIQVVIGGIHVTTNPQEPANYGASAVAGEGELVWPEILKDAARRRLKPLYDVRGKEFDLSDAPMPAFELLDPSRYNRITVQTSRGCPWRCAFCAGSILLTDKYKQKPIDKVLAEIDRICAIWPHPFIEFADDNSFVNKRYWKELLPKLAKRNFHWFTETDVSIHQDEDLLELMHQAGCRQVLIGLESPATVGLDGLETRRNWKLGQFGQYHAAIESIQSHGITVNACFIIGLDGQGPDVFDSVRGFVSDALPYDVQITLPTAFPGTPFYEQLLREGRLIEAHAWERCTLFDINFIPERMSVEELRTGFHALVTDLYEDTFTQQRREHFKNQLRRARPLHPETVRSAA